MGKFTRFEDIQAWQLSRQLVKNIYATTSKRSFSKDHGLKDQMQRAAVSTMANIAEGFERYSNKEFIQYLNIARGSMGEVRSHLCVALDLNYIDDKEFGILKEKAEHISKSIWNLIKYLKENIR
jgi:four helix bundle protein